METSTGKIAIPNAVAEDCVVNNLSRNRFGPLANWMQGLELTLDLETDNPFSPDQISDLLFLARAYANHRVDLINPCLTVELRPGAQQTLICISLVNFATWREYIELKESITLVFNQFIDRVDKSHFVLSVSYDTTDQQLSEIPGILQGVIDKIPGFELKACRLLVIADFSYDFKCHLFCHSLPYKQFKDSIDLINRDLLRTLASAQIVIPYPTEIKISR